MSKKSTERVNVSLRINEWMNGGQIFWSKAEIETAELL